MKTSTRLAVLLPPVAVVGVLVVTLATTATVNAVATRAEAAEITRTASGCSWGSAADARPHTTPASTLPTVRPVNRHPPRKVPSRALYPWAPPPPKPAASPAA